MLVSPVAWAVKSSALFLPIVDSLVKIETKQKHKYFSAQGEYALVTAAGAEHQGSSL